MISICKIKICSSSIYKPVDLIFSSCLIRRKFPFDWEMAYVVHVNKKVINTKKSKKVINTEKCLNNYYLTKCSKFLSKINQFH